MLRRDLGRTKETKLFAYPRRLLQVIIRQLGLVEHKQVERKAAGIASYPALGCDTHDSPRIRHPRLSHSAPQTQFGDPMLTILAAVGCQYDVANTCIGWRLRLFVPHGRRRPDILVGSSVGISLVSVGEDFF